MKYYSVSFDHDGGTSLTFLAIKKFKREAIEKYLEKAQGFKNVILIRGHEFKSKSDYEQAQRIATGSV